MKFDKFGAIALVVGLVVLLATLHFGFFGGGATFAGWTLNNFAGAVVTAVLGGLLLLGLFAMVIGILLLVV